MYAVVEALGKQYTVTKGSKIRVDAMSVPSGEKVELDRVLVISDDDGVVIGTPTIEGAKVVAESLGQDKGEKVLVFKYKRKTRYKRKIGHRQLETTLTIKNIVTGKPGKRSKAKQG